LGFSVAMQGALVFRGSGEADALHIRDLALSNKGIKNISLLGRAHSFVSELCVFLCFSSPFLFYVSFFPSFSTPRRQVGLAQEHQLGIQ